MQEAVSKWSGARTAALFPAVEQPPTVQRPTAQLQTSTTVLAPRMPATLRRHHRRRVIELRHRATSSVNRKDFNSVVVSPHKEVTVLLTEYEGDTAFHYVKYGRRQGFIKAKYVRM